MEARDIGDRTVKVKKKVVSGGAFCCSHGTCVRVRNPPLSQKLEKAYLSAYYESRNGKKIKVYFARRSRYYNNLVNLAGTGCVPNKISGGLVGVYPASHLYIYKDIPCARNTRRRY